MEQAYFSATQFQQWLKRIHTEKNREQQSELYSKLAEHLSVIFNNWCNISMPELLYKIIEILTPCVQNNLFSIIMRPESLNFMHPFPFSLLPIYIQKILISRKLESLPQFYRTYEIIIEQGFIVLPTPQFFLFSFMAESCRIREAEWFENTCFLESMYTDPFLILFTQYLQYLDPDLFSFLCVLSEEYLIKDIANKEAHAPSKHNCEMLLMLIYILQRPYNLLVPSHRMISVNLECIIFDFHDSLYKYFKNLCLSWQEGSNSYCCFVAEVWLQYLTPWKNSPILDSYLTSEVFPVSNTHKNDQNFTGEESFWEEYIENFILFYTEIFGLMLRLLCSEILFRSGDIDFLTRLSSVFTQDSEGFLFLGHINLRLLHQQSKLTQGSIYIEKTLSRLGVNKSVLYPFNDTNVRTTAENLIFKASSLGYRESIEIKENWSLLLGVREINVVEDRKEHLKLKPNFSRSLLNPWDKPLRSDELWILYILCKYLAWAIDLLKKQESWPPRTNLRFCASITNLMFILVVVFSLSYLLF